jgi:hypothetical protein
MPFVAIIDVLFWFSSVLILFSSSLVYSGDKGGKDKKKKIKRGMSFFLFFFGEAWLAIEKGRQLISSTRYRRRSRLESGTHKDLNHTFPGAEFGKSTKVK